MFNKEIEITPFKISGYDNPKCRIVKNIVPTIEFYLKNRDYYLRTNVYGTNLPINPKIVCIDPDPLTLDKDIRYSFIAVLKEQIHADLEAINVMLSQLKHDGIIKEDQKEITIKDVGDEFLNSTEWFKRIEELNKEVK